MPDETPPVEPTVPTEPPVEPTEDPWPEREQRVKFHDGWGVRQVPPTPPQDEASV